MAHLLKMLLVVFSLLLTESNFAQSMGGLTKQDKFVQTSRIGLVDEFMDRFNGKSSHPEISSSQSESRKNNILMTFNLAMFSSKKDSLFIEAEKFADVIVKNNVSLNYSDTTWYAKAHCVGTLNGKEAKFTVYLTVQSRGKDMYKWTITKVDAGFFNVKPITNKEAMLYPDDHETNFMSLGHISKEQPRNIVKFMRNDFTYDQSSVFAYLMYNKMLKIDHVEKLEFVFTQVPGYIFTISYFEREKNNAGWLISSFKKVNDKAHHTINNKATISYKQDKGQAKLKNDDETALDSAVSNFLRNAGTVYCQLLDPMSNDTTRNIRSHYEVLQSDTLSTEATGALTATLLYPQSFARDSFVKDCTFLPDVIFIFKSHEHTMELWYSFYCDVCKLIYGNKQYTYNGENVRTPILQIAMEVFPKDRYLRRIAGKTR